MSDGKKVVVSELPKCDFCVIDPEPARYDFKTKTGSWANGCFAHWKRHRASISLGTGLGQRLVLKSEVVA